MKKMTKQEMLDLARSLRARRIMCDGGNGNVYDIADEECDQAAEIIERVAELPQSSQQSAVEVERSRCLAACEGWIERYQNTEIKYTSARDYAIDAVEDIADLIRNGTPVSRPTRESQS